MNSFVYLGGTASEDGGSSKEIKRRESKQEQQCGGEWKALCGTEN